MRKLTSVHKDQFPHDYVTIPRGTELEFTIRDDEGEAVDTVSIILAYPINVHIQSQHVRFIWESKRYGARDNPFPLASFYKQRYRR